MNSATPRQVMMQNEGRLTPTAQAVSFPGRCGSELQPDPALAREGVRCPGLRG